VWQYRTPSGRWTRKYPAGGSFVVDCPAPPPVVAALTHDCTHARLATTLGTFRHGSLRPLYNGTAHRMVLVLNGAVSGRYVVAPKTAATIHMFRVACGTRAVIAIRSGVQRTSGEYNYGDPVTITVP
jgi:hypothetical protein